MFLSQSLFQAVEAAIKQITPRDFRIQSITPASGGDINRAYRIQTQQGHYFIKVNDAAYATRLFLAESEGLSLLRGVYGVNAPRTYTFGQAHNEAFILMEWISPTGRNNDVAQEQLGYMMATLHRQHADTFGLDHNNFIGSLPQNNTQSTNWTDFFIQQRLQNQLDIAQSQLAGADLQKKFDQLYNHLEELYPEEPPSLLHGDLWSGNYLITGQGQPVLIDPAVYYGHREMDTAMTKLFGGFTDRFYAAYNEAFPLQFGWQHRVELWNLYPLLVHFNLFGESYLDPLQRSLRTYL